MSEPMNDYVLAQLNKLVVDARVKLERVRSLQRQTPSLGTSNTRQIVLQRQVKELLSQARTWELALTLVTEYDPVTASDRQCVCMEVSLPDGASGLEINGVSHLRSAPCYVNQ